MTRPSIERTDATVENDFTLSERWKFDIRGGFYHLLNHTIFNSPGTTFGLSDADELDEGLFR